MIWITLLVTGSAAVLTGVLGGLSFWPFLIWIAVLVGIAGATELLTRVIWPAWWIKHWKPPAHSSSAHYLIVSAGISEVGGFSLIATLAYLVSYVQGGQVIQATHGNFNPSETVQIITAVSGLGVAIGTSVAAIIRAYALLIRARSELILAELSIYEPRHTSTSAQQQSEKTAQILDESQRPADPA
jgi:hypothetical protein